MKIAYPNAPAPQPFPLHKVLATALAEVKLTKAEGETIAKATADIRRNLEELDGLSPEGQKRKAQKLIEAYQGGDESVSLADIQNVTTDHEAAKAMLENTRLAVQPAIALAHDSVREIALKFQAAMESAFGTAETAFNGALETAGEVFGEDGLFDHLTARLDATAAALAAQRARMEGNGPAGYGLAFLCENKLAENPYRPQEILD